MYIIFDLDGTLANIQHRLHYIDRLPGQKDWPAFYAACGDDAPIEPLTALCRTLSYFSTVDIWSGRSDEVREQTEAWLKKHGINYRHLKMRKKGDHRLDYIVKGEWAKELTILPTVVFEDRQQVVDMWRSLGIICCQVNEGAY